MRDKPDTADILATARDLMRTRLVPALPEAERYHGLLVASALAIAARELAAGEGGLAAEAADLARLLDQPAASLAELNREFARRIRAGAYDASGEAREKAFAALKEATLRKLKECNPGYLEPAAR